ncbi:hypothetical protein AURDEDRAFT_186321 [Auricularia subglabra TFB-10046 SS5]|nr:hypothetical protein AURDEDRAFT_186321 [Auricularia subglabra TFB-10046 SS5]
MLEAWLSAAASQWIFTDPSRSSAVYNARLGHVHRLVLHHLRAQERALNGRHALVKLPDLVLDTIFLWAGGPDSRALACTCKLLHTRCTTLLPAVITIIPRSATNQRIESSVARAFELARQSLPRPLARVALTWWAAQHGERLVRFFADNMARIRALKVVLHVSEYSALLFEALALPAPLLQRLHVVARYHSSLIAPPPPTTLERLITQHFRSLNTLRIAGLQMPLESGVVFGNIRDFCWVTMAPRTMDRGLLHSLLSCMPSLEALRLRTTRFIWDALTLPVPSQLRRMDVHLVDSKGLRAVATNLLEFLCDSRIPDMTTTLLPAAVGRKCLFDLARVSTEATVGCFFYEFLAYPDARQDAKPSTVRLLQTSESLGWGAIDRRRLTSKFRHLTSLTLLEVFWPPEGSGRPTEFRALKNLRISLAPCPALRRLHHDDRLALGILLEVSDPLASWYTPALQTLDISYYLLPETSRTRTVCLRDVQHFVAKCVRLADAQRLDILRVNGVDVVDLDPVPYMTLLEQYIGAHVLRSLQYTRDLGRVNGQNALVILPDRVLRPILLQANVLDRYALAGSCKRLRERCNTLDVLRQTTIHHVQPLYYLAAQSPPAGALEWATALARQTFPKDLESVTLTWWPELSEQLARFLTGNMSRIHSLKILLPVHVSQRPHCGSALSAALGTPAAKLTDLHLVVDARAAPFVLDVFDEPAGRYLSSLRRLRISSMRLPLHVGLVFAEVREFCWFNGAPSSLNRDMLVSLVVCMPKLETLHVRCGCVSWAPDALPVRSSLHHVHVDECGQIDNLPGFLGGTRIELLTITHPPMKTFRKLMDAIVRASTSISYGNMFYECITKPPSPADRAQVIRCLASTMPLHLDKRHFLPSLRQMTCLTLLELFWPRAKSSGSGSAYVFGPATSMTALTCLRVSLVSCRDRRHISPDERDICGILLGLDDPLAPWQTPALRNLEISYDLVPESSCKIRFSEYLETLYPPCCCCRTLCVSLHDIHRFVASCIRLPKGRRLEQIRINGVEVVDPDPFPYMALLEEVATVVSVSRVSRPNRRDLGITLWENTDDYVRLDEFP